MVFFLGGCTFTEISALRWMSKQTKGRHFLIATTGIINGNTASLWTFLVVHFTDLAQLLESLGDQPPVALDTSR